MSTPTPRRSSLGMLLRRTKSSDLKKGSRKISKQEQAARDRDGISKSPPRLPQLYNGAHAPQFDNQQQYNGSAAAGMNRPDSIAIMSGRGHHQSHQSQPPPMPNMYRGQSMDQRFAHVPVPPIPNGSWDPHARTESMTHRGRYSYASSAFSTVNNPRRVRRRKDPTTFNILIIGTRGAGKTSFLEFLKSSLALPLKKRTKSTADATDEAAVKVQPTGSFIPHYLESEIDGERVGVTLWDSEGLEKNVVDLQLREMSSFLESKFEDTFNEEMKVVRTPGVHDTHIHAAFLVLDPARLDRNVSAAKRMASAEGDTKYAHHARLTGALDEDLDLQVMRTLQGKTTIIPVIAKADTITAKHMDALKKAVWSSMRAANIDPLHALGLDEVDEVDDDESDRIEEEPEPVNGNGNGNGTSHEYENGETNSSDHLPIQGNEQRSSAESRAVEEIPLVPLSILSPDIYEPEVVGRQFPWGFADPYNPDHCDYQRLKDAVFSDWRGDLREVSKEQWYEGWRTSRLKQRDLPHRMR